MEIGKAIVEDEKLHIDDIEYENKSLRYLSKVLTNKFEKGFFKMESKLYDFILPKLQWSDTV